jgi:hypothetical protein
MVHGDCRYFNGLFQSLAHLPHVYTVSMVRARPYNLLFPRENKPLAQGLMWVRCKADESMPPYLW